MADAERRARTPEPGIHELFAGAQQGDPAAVDGLLRAMLPTAQRFAARSCASKADAEEAAQDALTALVRRVGALRAAETVSSWLYVTIRNACRGRTRYRGMVLVPLDGVPDAASADRSDASVARLVVAEALADLSPVQREVIVLVDLLGLPMEQAAARLGIGERAAKSRLHRARRALADRLADSPLRSHHSHPHPRTA